MQKRLRLPPKAEEKTLDLDLREAFDRERSHMLRRLRLLGVEWGEPAAHAGGRGTFHELWKLAWKPEFAISLIEASRHGHTVAQAAANLVAERCAREDVALKALIVLLEDALFADLAAAIGALVAAIENRAALASRRAPAAGSAAAAGGRAALRQRTRDRCVAGGADSARAGAARVRRRCRLRRVGIDDEAAQFLHQHMIQADGALGNLANEEYLTGWRESLLKISRNDAAHRRIAGYAVRLLYDAHVIEFDALEKSFALSLSPGSPPAEAAAWTEGFLSGSGALLIHDDKLLGLLNNWLQQYRRDALHAGVAAAAADVLAVSSPPSGARSASGSSRPAAAARVGPSTAISMSRRRARSCRF